MFIFYAVQFDFTRFQAPDITSPEVFGKCCNDFCLSVKGANNTQLEKSMELFLNASLPAIDKVSSESHYDFSIQLSNALRKVEKNRERWFRANPVKLFLAKKVYATFDPKNILQHVFLMDAAKRAFPKSDEPYPYIEKIYNTFLRYFHAFSFENSSRISRREMSAESDFMYFFNYALYYMRNGYYIQQKQRLWEEIHQYLFAETTLPIDDKLRALEKLKENNEFCSNALNLTAIQQDIDDLKVTRAKAKKAHRVAEEDILINFTRVPVEPHEIGQAMDAMGRISTPGEIYLNILSVFPDVNTAKTLFEKIIYPDDND